MNIALWGIVGLWMVNFVLLYYRRSAWFKSGYKWLAVSIPFIIGLVLFLTTKSHDWEVSVAFSILMSYLCFSLIDYGFERLSFVIHGRDFYLWLKSSSDLRNGQVQFKASDRILSILFLYIVIALPVLPLLLINVIKGLL